MATVLYDKARQAFLAGTISFSGDNIKAVLIDTGVYSPSFSTNTYLSDIPAGARIGISGNLASKTVTDGIADAADIIFPLLSGPTVEAIALFKDTGSAASSPLICYIDSGTGLPFTPNGGDLNVAWNNGTNKIFKL